MKLAHAKVMHDQVVLFTLDDGRQVERDFSLIDDPLFDKPWRTPRQFGKIKVINGRPSWPGALTFCPEVVLRGGQAGRLPKRAFVGEGVLFLPKVVSTAYHEAGHAVVGFQLGRNVPRKVSIRPAGESLGRSENRPFPPSFRPELRLLPRTRQIIETEMVTILSGFEAEKLQSGRANYVGVASDFAGSQVYAGLVADDDLGRTLYTQWCIYRARNAVSDNWPAIDRFARDLLKVGELHGRKLKRVLTTACRLVKYRERSGVRDC